MYRSLGPDIVSSSLKELYRTGQEGRRATEDEIYETFLSNTPPAKQDEFRELYTCLHGRPIPGYAPAPATTPSQARDALAALYEATNGPGWNNNDNWLSEAPIDQWYGVITYAVAAPSPGWSSMITNWPAPYRRSWEAYSIWNDFG